MSDNQKQQYYSGEDNEIEIVDLPSPSASGATAGADGSRRISLSARYSPQQRRRRLMLSGGIVLLLLLIAVAISPTRELIGTALFPPAPTSQVKDAGKAGFFYVQVTPAWGKWYLDGRQLARVPVFSDEKPLRIEAGRHQLTWRAEPFPELSCTLLVPADPAHQTCRTRWQGANEYASSSNVINLPVPPSISQLPPAQRQALLQATRDYLDGLRSSALVQPGEMYRYNTTGTPRTAAQTLQARLSFQLDTDASAPGRCTGPQLGPACTNAANGSDCRLYCTLAWSERDIPPGWDVGVVTRPHWEYIAPDQSSDSEAARLENQGDQQFTTLHITRQQDTWHVSAHPQGDSPFDDPNCIAVVGKIPNMIPFEQDGPTVAGTTGNEGRQIVRSFLSGSNRAMGCVATAKIDKTASPDQPHAASNAYFLWRFNILLAVNDEAHQLWKELPLSGQAGRSIVQEITEHAAFAS